MPLPRKALISLDATPYYHCISRCVRKAFLCGTDSSNKQSYEHRREWAKAELLLQAQAFTIDIAAYAVMHNHWHVVLHIDKESNKSLSTKEVVQRWHTLFKGNVISQKYDAGETLNPGEQAALNDVVDVWRNRLADISWFMRRINESIARQANKEDRCTGRFWEGRFKSQALLDEAALAACMAYVDLNPIRACIATTPENSDYTSVQQRTDTTKTTKRPNQINQQSHQLLPFVGYERDNMPKGLPFKLSDYLELVDWTGRIIRDDKRGAIRSNLPSILTRLGIEPEQWINSTQHFESRFKQLVGRQKNIKKACEQLQKKWVHGTAVCAQAFS